MKYRIYLILISVSFVASSCEGFLEKEPLDFLSPTNYFETEDQLTASIAGVYDKLGAVYGTNWVYRLGLEADEGFFSKKSPVNGPQYYNYSTSHTYILSAWSNLFSGINRANVLLENVDKNTELDESLRNRVRGEALFLRGYYYFILVQSFGGVPIFTAPTGSVKNTDTPRNTVAEVYDQILSDMKAAESLVPSIMDIGFGGRVSKSAVRGILARVCLQMAGYPLQDISKFTDARDWAKKVIDDSEAGHALNPDYSNIFIRIARDEYDIKESIFEVEFWGNRTDAYTETGYVGFANGPATSNEITGNGFGGIQATAKLYYSYAEGDLRRDWNIANFTYDATGPSGSKTMLTKTTETSLYDREAAKFRREYEVLIPKAKGRTPQNLPILRYSDVLLMFAEAENEVSNGPTPDAYDAINQVRRRAFGKLVDPTNIDEYDLTGLDYVEFKSEVQDERMRELAFEYLRKFDLVRWGIFTSEMNQVLHDIDRVFIEEPFFRKRYKDALSEKHLLWPIPATEIVQNRLMEQNPGW